jgi:hypothetical protein
VELLVSAQSLAKGGNTEAENEDAWGAATSLGPRVHRFALSDGATETSFSREWATILARAYIAGADSRRRLLLGMSSSRKAWEQSAKRKPLPWYAEQKLKMGAFATLLGMRFTDAGAPASRHTTRNAALGQWKATAIGDTCLFIIRNRALRRAWPLYQSKDFGNRPILLRSTPQPELLSPGLLETAGSCVPHDSFFLTTDAVAQWLLREFECGRKPWEDLGEALTRQDDFVRLIRSLRERGQIRNDDVTAVRITVTD